MRAYDRRIKGRTWRKHEAHPFTLRDLSRQRSNKQAVVGNKISFFSFFLSPKAQVAPWNSWLQGTKKLHCLIHLKMNLGSQLLPARVSVLSMTSTCTLPEWWGSDVPIYCGMDTKDTLSPGHLKYELALKVSGGCTLQQPNLVLSK